MSADPPKSHYFLPNNPWPRKYVKRWRTMNGQRQHYMVEIPVMLTSIKITVDASINGTDDDLQQAMIAVIRETGESLYAQLALVSKYAPTIKVEIVDEQFGLRNVKLFDSGE